MNKKILKLIEANARLTSKDLATICEMPEDEVKAEIAEMEHGGVIKGYKTIIDWEKADTDTVSAIIELKVTPTAGLGFDDVAARISQFPSVESVYLMSGACDLIVIVTGKTFREVSLFVSSELATIDSVTSTATQFIMRRYKELGVELSEPEEDGRGTIVL